MEIASPQSVRAWLHKGSPIAAAIVSDMSGQTQWERVPLTADQTKIAEAVGQFLVTFDAPMCAIDFVDDILIDVNVNTPGRIKELSDASGVDIAELICHHIEELSSQDGAIPW